MHQTNEVNYTYVGVLLTAELPFSAMKPLVTQSPIIDDDEPDFPIIADGE